MDPFDLRSSAQEKLQLADAAEQEGRLDEALSFLEEAFNDHAEYGHGPDLAFIQMRLGNLHHALGNLDAAIPWLHSSLTSLQAVYGSSHGEVATVHVALAHLYEETGEIDQALDSGRKAVAIFMESLEEHDSRLIQARLRLSQLLLSQNNLQEAYTNLQAAQKSAELAEDHASLATVYGIMGQLYEAAKEPGHAETCLRNAIELFSALPEHQAELSIARTNLAHLLMRQQQWESATVILLQSVEAFTAEGQTSTQAMAEILMDLSQAYLQRQQLDAAENTLRQAYQIYLELFTHDDPALAPVLKAIGILLFRRKKLRESAQFLRPALQLSRQDADQEPNTLCLLNLLGILEKRNHNLEESENYLTEALKLARSIYGNRHPSLAIPLFNLAKLALTRNQPEKAATWLTEAATILKERLPKDWRRSKIESLLAKLA